MYNFLFLFYSIFRRFNHSFFRKKFFFPFNFTRKKGKNSLWITQHTKKEQTAQFTEHRLTTATHNLQLSQNENFHFNFTQADLYTTAYSRHAQSFSFSLFLTLLSVFCRAYTLVLCIDILIIFRLFYIFSGYCNVLYMVVFVCMCVWTWILHFEFSIWKCARIANVVVIFSSYIFIFYHSHIFFMNDIFSFKIIKRQNQATNLIIVKFFICCVCVCVKRLTSLPLPSLFFFSRCTFFINQNFISVRICKYFFSGSNRMIQIELAHICFIV